MQLTKTTRLASLDDIPALLEIAKEFFLASPFREFNYDEKKVRTLFEYAIVNKSQFIVVCSVTESDEIVGMICGRLEDAPFSSDRTAIETAWYIKPEWRKGRRGFELLTAFEAWASALDCSYTYYGNLKEMANIEDDVIDRFYKHHGCHPVERGYLKRLK